MTTEEKTMKKTDPENQLKSDSPLSTDPYDAVIAQATKRRIIALIVSILIFGFLLYLSAQGILQTHWFTFLLFSVSWGSWALSFSQFFSWIAFLRRRLKNQPSPPMPISLVTEAFRKARRSLISLSVGTGVCTLTFILLFIQQPDKNGDAYIMTFSDMILSLALSVCLASITFFLIAGLIKFFLHIILFKSPSHRRSLNYLHYLGENYPFFSSQKFEDDLVSQFLDLE